MSDELRDVFRRASSEPAAPPSIDDLYQVLRRRRARRRTLRSTAALAVSAVTVAVAVLGVQHVGSGEASPSGSGVPTASSSAPPTPTPTPSSSPTRVPLSPPTPSRTTQEAATPPTIIDVDLTTGTTAWALISESCATGRCLELSRSNDSGRTWHRLPVTVITTKQAAHVTFVTDQTGFLWGGPSDLFRTDNAGQTWQLESSPPVVGLVPAAGNAIRLVGIGGGCPSYCHELLQHSEGNRWVTTYDGGSAPAISLVSNGTVAYGIFAPNFAGGDDQPTVLVRSGDGGTTWTAIQDSCGNPASHPTEQTATAYAGGDRLALQCQDHIAFAPLFAVSTDTGLPLAPRRNAPGTQDGSAAWSGHRLVAATLTQTQAFLLSTSDDNGRSWTTRISGKNPIFDTGEPAPQKLQFSGSFGVFLGPPSYLLVSHDSGRTWARITVNNV